jgi:hypothetical protein
MASQLRTLVACCDCEDRHLLVRLITRIGLTPFLTTSTHHAVSMLRSGSSTPGGGSDLGQGACLRKQRQRLQST